MGLSVSNLFAIFEKKKTHTLTKTFNNTQHERKTFIGIKQ